MIKRKTAKLHKKTPNIFSVFIDGKGEHHFRIPHDGVRGALSTLLAGVDNSSIAGKELSELSTKQQMKVLGPMMGLVGATVGACWAHEVWILETDRSELFEDPDAYSDTVLSELKHEKYTQDEIMQLFSVCLEKIIGETVANEEVAAATDFLAQKEASSPSLPSITE